MRASSFLSYLFEMDRAAMKVPALRSPTEVFFLRARFGGPILT
jgi:hypothetical protein